MTCKSSETIEDVLLFSLSLLLMVHEGVVFFCFSPLLSTDLSSPELVAAQGGLVSVGSSYVTYIDKKGQVRVIGWFDFLRMHVEH